MGRSRSRRRDKEEKKEKKRSRSRKEKKRSRSKKRRAQAEEPAPPPRQRSPSFQYRRWRFDSPPKEEEYQRDAMLTGNPMGLGGVAAALQGGLALGGVNSQTSPLTLAADTKAMRELYVGNLPAGITAAQLTQFLNQVAQAVKVNSLPGEPILSATMGGGGLFAFVEFRTAEEAANGLRLNGVELLGCQLKVGRPKGYTGPEGGQAALPGPDPALVKGLPALPGMPGQGGSAVVSAIDHRLCLVNIPTFVSDERIKELLTTFGQLKFFALQKDEQGKSVGVAFFEYNDMMTQQQARAALEGLELGAKKLSVKKPEEVIQMGLVSREQKLGARVVPSKVLYLKNIVTPDDLRADSSYVEICQDIRLEAEKFGPVVSLEVPRSRGAGGGANRVDGEALPANALMGGALALEDTKPNEPAAPKALPKAPSALAPAPIPTNPLAVVPLGEDKGSSFALAIPGTLGGPIGGGADGAPGGAFDPDTPGMGFAFIEFATIEGSSKAKKALNGRRFGENTVEAEYFSEDKYYIKDFKQISPNTDEPKRDPGTMELVLSATQQGDGDLLDEAPVMAD